jgi:hypothetical protein
MAIKIHTIRSKGRSEVFGAPKRKSSNKVIFLKKLLLITEFFNDPKNFQVIVTTIEKVDIDHNNSLMVVPGNWKILTN